MTPDVLTQASRLCLLLNCREDGYGSYSAISGSAQGGRLARQLRANVATLDAARRIGWNVGIAALS